MLDVHVIKSPGMSETTVCISSIYMHGCLYKVYTRTK
jgi:hypothetical protein